ncbi:unnamed protein product [Urochloa decumbens]|uniref:F-box domain-containing protein n=1 Tax=Urochloa decumbens TaxID=240449 RepID=A0ABC8WBX0_9POAL
MAASSTPPPASDWAALPRNVLWSIFTELGHHEVLSVAGLACTAWRRLARDEPDLWRRIDLTVPEKEEDDDEEEEVSDDEEQEGNIFSSFDDDDDGYGYGRRIYWQKTPAKVADDGDLISDDDEISMLDLFNDTAEDAPICQEKNNTPVEDDSDDTVQEKDGTAEDDHDGGDVVVNESLHLFDDTDDDMEETPAKQDGDDTADDDDGDDTADDDDDTAEDGGENLSDGEEESMCGLFDGAPIDSEKTPATDEGTMDSDDDEDGTVDDEDDDSPVCQEETLAEDCSDSPAWKAMAIAAIDRSAGQCEAFWGHADDEVLLYLADRAPSMKSLRLTYHYDVSSEVFTELIMKFPLLEELELVLKYDTYNYSTKPAQSSTNSWVELFQSACKACSHLHHFTVRSARSGRYYPRGPWSAKLFSIPVMRGLHSFELSGDSSFTIDVATQIVDNCPNLKSLNISDLLYEEKWELQLLNNKCYRIKDLKLPAKFYEPDIDYSDDDMS